MVPATILLLVNLALALGFGVAFARSLAISSGGGRGIRHPLLMLLGIYLAECVAFSASMATNLIGYGLALVWGVVFARRLHARETLSLALYTSLPALSFLSVLAVLTLAGWPVLSTDGGRRFGVPPFVPWPFCTLVGFFLTVSLSAVVLKTAITTVTAAIVRKRERYA